MLNEKANQGVAQACPYKKETINAPFPDAFVSQSSLASFLTSFAKKTRKNKK